MWQLWLRLALLTLLCACVEKPSEERVTLIVDAEAELALQLTRIEVSGARQSATFWLRDAPAGASTTAFPFSLELLGPGPKTVRVAGYAGDERRVLRIVTLTFPAKGNAYGVLLSSACIGSEVRCSEQQGLTCDCGTCVPIAAVEPVVALHDPRGDLEAYLAAPLVCGPDGAMQEPRGDDPGGDLDGSMGDLDGTMDDADANSSGDGAIMTLDDGAIMTLDDGAIVTPDQDAQVTGALEVKGSLILAAGRCRPLTLRRQDAQRAETALLDAASSLIVASDPQCAQPSTELHFAAGEAEKTLYVQHAPLEHGENGRQVTLSVASTPPLEVTLDVRRAAVSIGGATHMACALLDDLSMQCWGSGERNLLTRWMDSAPVPVRASGVPALHPGAELIANGSANYLLDQGRVYAWGGNDHRQLGRGSSDWSNATIALVSGLENDVTQLSAGYYHACAVKGGDAYCWGWNDHNQAGNVDDNVPLPRRVSELPSGKVVAVVAADYHSCALLMGGEVRCWGANGSGQLGNGNTVDSAAPVAVTLPGGGSATQLWAELNTTCALVDGHPYCWGDGWSTVPALVTNTLPQVDQISPALDGILCLRSDGKAYCRGYNRGGWLGTGRSDEFLSSLRQVPLPGTLERLELSYGYAPTLTALVDGVVYTWGYDAGWSLGTTPDAACQHAPRRTSLFDGLEVEQGSVRLNKGTGCLVHATTGAVSCWGNGREGVLGRDDRYDADRPVPVPGLTEGVTQLAMGYVHVVAACDGRLCAWGANSEGQIGAGHDGYVPNMVEASVLPASAKVAKVAAGDFSTCALVQDSGAQDGVFCWGRDAPPEAGAIGDADTHEDTGYRVLTAVRVYAADAEVTDLSARGETVCVVIDGGVQCWGPGPASPVPVDIVGLEPGAGRGIVAVELGAYNACARSAAGDVYCWGGDFSQVTKIAISDVDQLRVSDTFACALTGAQRLYCWNFPGAVNECGELGLGDTLVRSAPTRLTTLSEPVYDFAVGDQFACARDGKGWKCWGRQRTHLAGFTPWIVSKPEPLYPWAQTN